MRRAFIFLLTSVLAFGLAPVHATTPGSPGDINCDGQVAVADALHVLRRLAGLDGPISCSASSQQYDADGNGTLSLTDAIVIRRWTAGLPVRPRLLSISPGKLTAGSPATDVVVFGGFLTSGTTLRWGAVTIPLALVDDGSVAIASLSAGNLAPIATLPVSLASPGVDEQSAPLLYELVAPQGCSPANGNTGTILVTKNGMENARVSLVAPQNLTGWQLVSVRGNQRYTFPVGYVYDPSQGFVRVWSNTTAFAGTQSDLWWRSSSVWADSDDDDAQLIDCAGNEVAYWDDPKVPGTHP